MPFTKFRFLFPTSHSSLTPTLLFSAFGSEAKKMSGRNRQTRQAAQQQARVADSYQVIDPAITASDDAPMPPPPVPSAKNPAVARRGTRRDARAPSIASINSLPMTDVFSSQQEPQSKCMSSVPQLPQAPLLPGLTGHCSPEDDTGTRLGHSSACYIRGLL